MRGARPRAAPLARLREERFSRAAPRAIELAGTAPDAPCAMPRDGATRLCQAAPGTSKLCGRVPAAIMQDSLGQTELAPLRGIEARPPAVQGQGVIAALLRNLDVPLVILFAIPALALGAPSLGYAVGAVAWITQRILAKTDRRWIKQAREPRTQLGLNLFEAFGRIWLLAGAIVAAGLIGGRPDGLTAALVIFGAYSIAFAIRVLTGPPDRRADRDSSERAAR